MSSQSSLGTGVTTWGIILPGSVLWSAAIEFTHWNSLQIEKRHESVASAVQTSLLLMNYSRAHFRGNEILNGVLRTSSAECMAELRKVIDLNGESVVELMKRGKNSQFTRSEGGQRWDDKRLAGGVQPPNPPRPNSRPEEERSDGLKVASDWLLESEEISQFLPIIAVITPPESFWRPGSFSPELKERLKASSVAPSHSDLFSPTCSSPTAP